MQYPASHSASLPGGWWDGRDGQMDAWIGEKLTWWKNLALAKANHHPMPGQGVPGRPCLALMITELQDSCALYFAFLDCPGLSAPGQVCLVMMVCTSQAFLSFQARTVVQICKKMFVFCFLCPSGTNAAVQGGAVLQPLGWEPWAVGLFSAVGAERFPLCCS